MWQAVLDRKIDWIVSDHACCSAEQKWSKDEKLLLLLYLVQLLHLVQLLYLVSLLIFLFFLILLLLLLVLL